MKTIAILLFVTFLTACAKTEGEVEGNLISNGDGQGTVVEHTLSDGTKCAIFVGYYKGAISCGWK